MKNPWELRSADTRIEDSLPTYIIFCEDEVCEKLYFKYFETEKIKVNIIDNQKAMMNNVINAITYCKENNLLKESENEFKLDADQVQVWCVYDRDLESNPDHHTKGNTEFDEAIATAHRKGFKVAWSNDAFELWVLLHFEDIIPEVDYSRRIIYYERLTEFLSSHSDPNEDLKKALSHQTFGYKKDMKHKNNFRDIIRPMMILNTLKAIERAKQLELVHSQTHHHHQKSPCTLVYKLVEELMTTGEKVI